MKNTTKIYLIIIKRGFQYLNEIHIIGTLGKVGRLFKTSLKNIKVLRIYIFFI